MPSPAQSERKLRFEQFELNLGTRELRNNGRRLILQEQPYQILAALLEQPGELVTREELRRRLWPPDTYVDFERSLNKAVNRLREVLEDSAEQPRFIETLPRQGYRFIAPVVPYVVSGGRSSVTPIPELQAALGRNKPQVVRAMGFGFRGKRRALGVGIAAALTTLVTVDAWQYIRHKPRSTLSVPELKLQQLTAESSENAVTGGAISPDGKYLAYANVRGIHIKLIGTDQIRDVPSPEEFHGTQVTWLIPSNWTNDGTGFLANADPVGHQPSIWAVPALGGPMHKIRDNALALSVSRDGDWAAFGTNLNQSYYREIWRMKPDGSSAQKLFDAEPNSSFVGAEWSPDGQRLGYVKWYESANKGELSIESRGLSGDAPVRAVSIPYDLADWSWSSDGRIITSFPDPSDLRANTCNFWETRIDSRTGKPLEELKRMTNWSGFCVDEPTVSADAKRLAFRRVSEISSVFVAELQSNGTPNSPLKRLTLSEGRNYPVGWAPDAQSVFLISDRNGKRSIFRQSLRGESESLAVDLGNAAEAASAGTVELVVPQMSPDAAWVLFFAWSSNFASSAPVPLMRVSVDGGPPQLVLSTTMGAVHSLRCAQSSASNCVIAERMPDHGQLIFTTFDPLRGREKEAARFDTVPTPDAEYTWDLSPDGTRIAVLKRSENKIQIISVSDHASREVFAKGSPNLQAVKWSADGKRLFISALKKDSSALLLLDLDGSSHVVGEFGGVAQPGSSPFMGGSFAPWTVPSPDGRHLAICTWNVSANMWMMEGF